MPAPEPAWIRLTPITVELPEDLVPLKARLEALLAEQNQALFLDLGVRFPRVAVWENADLSDGAYRLFLNEVPMGGSLVRAGMHLVNEPANRLREREFDCVHATHPATQRASAWISGADVDGVRDQGLKAQDAAEVVAQHVGALLTRHARSFVKVQNVHDMLDALEAESPAVVKAVVPSVVSLLQLTEVLGRLVEEEVSIRDLPAILQCIGEQWRPTMTIMRLTEEVRTALRLHLSHKFSHRGGTMVIYLLEPAIEEAIRTSIRTSADGTSHLALEPEVAQEICTAVRAELNVRPHGAQRPVILTTSDIRRYVRKLLEYEFTPPFTVVSYQELAPELNIEPVARISLPS